MTINELAGAINGYCQAGQWFWAYGLLKETAPLWVPEKWLTLLSAEAKIVLEDCIERRPNETT